MHIKMIPHFSPLFISTFLQPFQHKNDTAFFAKILSFSKKHHSGKKWYHNLRRFILLPHLPAIDELILWISFLWNDPSHFAISILWYLIIRPILPLCSDDTVSFASLIPFLPDFPSPKRNFLPIFHIKIFKSIPFTSPDSLLLPSFSFSYWFLIPS